MTTWLYILPQATETLDAQPCWLMQHAQGVTETTLADCARMLEGKPVKVLLPMERFGWHLCAPWRHRGKPTTEAMLFELEEQLLQPAESLCAWRGQRHADNRHELWITDRQAHHALVDYLRRALPTMVGLCIDADCCAPSQPGAVWIARRWLVGGKGLPRLAASEAWLGALERDSDQPISRLEAPDNLWAALQGSMGLDLLESRNTRAHWPWVATLAIAACAFGLVCAAEYRVGSTLIAGNLALAHSNEQRMAQLYPGQPPGPALLARLSGASVNARSGALPALVALLQQLDATPGVQVLTIERGADKRWRLSVSAQRLEDIHLDRKQWRMLKMTAEEGRWHGSLEEIGT